MPHKHALSAIVGLMATNCLFLVLAVTVAYATAVLAYPIIRRRSATQFLASSACSVIMFCCPLIIPPTAIQLRAMAMLLSADLTFRIVDFTRQSRDPRWCDIHWRTYCAFRNPFPTFLVVFNLRSRRIRNVGAGWWPLWRVFLGGAFFTATLCVTIALRTNPRLRENFWLDHAVKVVLFTIAIESLSQLLWGLERIWGFETTPLVNFAFLARTPAEFWHRYNQRVRWWLTLNVFLPAGGLRNPVRGVFATCFVSAVLHELAFGIATSCFDGYQFLFFAIQAPAIIASRPLERLATNGGLFGDICSRLVTVAWMGLTSILFFRGVDRVFPFVYVGEPWLR